MEARFQVYPVCKGDESTGGPIGYWGVSDEEIGGAVAYFLCRAQAEAWAAMMDAANADSMVYTSELDQREGA